MDAVHQAMDPISTRCYGELLWIRIQGVLPRFISGLNSSYCECNVSLNIKILKCLVLNLTNMSNLHQREAVGRGSETQLQVDENVNYLTSRFNPLSA